MKKKLKKAQNGKDAAPSSKPQIVYGKQSFWENPLQLDWSHVLASQVFQGVASAASSNNANSFQNATLRYNQSVSPISWLPQNPNTSNQALYGMQFGGNAIIDAYIRNFIGENGESSNTQVPKTETKKKSKNDTKNQVTDEDLEDMQFDEEENPYGRMPSRYRVASMLGDSTPTNTNSNSPYDPNVLAASQELMAKFPNLRMTSGIRNWGDKDAHPKGRAMDFAGPDLNAAYEYYKNSIVPKYGFNPALPINHGTGPHIHLGYYQQGGYNMNTATSEMQKAWESFKNLNARGKGEALNDNDAKELDRIETIWRKNKVPYKTEKSNNTTKTVWDLEWLKNKFDQKPVNTGSTNPPYQERPKHPYTKSVSEDNILPEVHNMFGAPHASDVGLSQGPTKYAFQYRDENGNQQVIYFPNSTKMAEFAKDQPWTDKSGGKDWWTITAPYIKKQKGGDIDTEFGIRKVDPRYIAAVQAANRPKTIVRFPGDSLTNNQIHNAALQVINKDAESANGLFGGWKVDPLKLGMLETGNNGYYQPSQKDLVKIAKELNSYPLGILHNMWGVLGASSYLPAPKKMDGGYHYGVIEEDMKKGGWIQHAVNPKHKGYCTPMTKSTCTGHRRAFALMMKKKHGFHKKQDGGLINETGYTEGSNTENNPMNIIPTGDITMARVYSPIVAVPHKDGIAKKPVIMHPENDYVFDADYTMEFKAGGEYELSPAHIEYLKKLGYEIEEIS